MEDLAPSSSSLSSLPSNDHLNISSSTSQLPTGSTGRSIWNVVYTILVSGVLWVFIRLGLPRLLNLFKSTSRSQSPSSTATSATADASHSFTGRPCDVFLNHRGPDVKKLLASTLYHWLEDKGLRVFLDNEEFQAGDGLHPTIEQAISSASVHIAIFSKRYAESSWCLDELCSMLKSGAKIIPVFYDVQPSDLRWIGKGKGLYAGAFAKHQENRRFLPQKLDQWKAALAEVSYLHGLELNSSKFSGDWGKLLKSTVDAVLEAVANKVALEVGTYPVGLDEAVQDFQNFIQREQQSKDEAIKIVGIVGLGGSGKTTLAKHFYNLHRSSFSRSSFLFDVRDASAKNTLQSLQGRLSKDLLGIDRGSFGSVYSHALRYSTPRVLIILDDIDRESQIEELLVQDVLGRGSLILITSRDEGAIRRYSQNASVYKIKPLNVKHARELFCRHAFGQPHPKIGFEDQVEKLCDKCRRLPLFLKVLGAHLRVNGNDDSDDWKEELEYMPDGIKCILEISYNALSNEEKQIFLDVACFFLGENKSMAIRVWNTSERWSSTRLRNLENKCLVEVDDKNCLNMHDHLRDFGREIANKEFPFRIWHLDQITNILDPLEGRTGVRGIKAATSAYSDCLTCHHMAFEKLELPRLKLLVIKGDCFQCRFGELSTNLTWLRWYDCPHTSIPSWLISMKHLTVLQLTGPNIKQWQVYGKELPLKELKIQNARLSDISIPEDVYPHLEHLDLSFNECLIEVESLPATLVVLNLTDCKILKRISGGFYLEKLKVLNIRGCWELKELPDLKHLSSLETLEGKNCSNLQNMLGLEHLQKLQKLDIGHCLKLRVLPNLSDLKSLETLEIYGCEKLQNIRGLKNLRKLQKLDISWCCELRELPNLSDLRSLESLEASYCRNLQNMQGLEHLRKLQKLDVSECGELSELPNLSDLSSLETLEARHCTKLQAIQGLEHLRKLQKLDITRCFEVRGLPNLSNLNSLETLEAYGCSKLQNIQGLEHLLMLQRLGISGCSELRELPNLSGLSSLETLDACDCGKLQNIQGLGQVRKLNKLDIRGCANLRELPNLSGLSSLETLELRDCSKLQDIQGLEHLGKLQMLDIRGCSELRELPKLSGLSSLQTLQAWNCCKLQNVQGLEQLRKLQKLGIAGCCELRELPELSDLRSLKTLKAGGCRKLQSIEGLEYLVKLQKLDVHCCSELRKLSNLSDLTSLETLEAEGCWELQSIRGLDKLQQLKLLNLSVADDSRGIVSSIKHLEKLPSILCVSGMGAGSHAFSFPRLPLIYLRFSGENSHRQWWKSKLPARTEENPFNTVMVCFVVQFSRVGCSQPVIYVNVKLREERRITLRERRVIPRGGMPRIMATYGDFDWPLGSRGMARMMATDGDLGLPLGVRVVGREGEGTCVAVFSQLMQSRSTTSTYHLEVVFPKLAMDCLQVKAVWMTTVSDANEREVPGFINQLFTSPS